MRVLFKERPLIFFLAAFAATLVVPLFVVAAVSSLYSAWVERERLQALANFANHDIVYGIDRELSAINSHLRVLASSPALAMRDIDAFGSQVRESLPFMHSTIVLRDNQGRPLHNSAIGGVGDASGREETAFIAESHVSVDEVGAMGMLRVSSHLFDDGSERLDIQMEIPVLLKGETRYRLSATIPAVVLLEVIAEATPDDVFHTSVLDGEGKIIARSRFHQRLQGKFSPIFSRIIGGRMGTAQGQDAEDRDIYAVWRRSEASGWIVVTAVSRAALAAPVRNSILGLSILATVLVVAGSGLATLILRKLTFAQRALVAGAEALGSGQSFQAPNTSLQEANQIGAAIAAASVQLNAQSRALNQKASDLERRVAIRTEELSGKSALLEATLESMDQGLLAFDSSQRVSVHNRRSCELLGLPEEVLAAKPNLGELIAFMESRISETSDVMRQIQTMLSVDESSTYEQERPCGLVLEVRTVTLDGGGFVRTFTDVTEKRRQTREVVVAKEEAEQASRAKSEFLATMSHEIRTPLNSIASFADMLVSDPSFSNQQRRQLNSIRNAALAILAVVGDVLDLSRIEAGAIELGRSPFTLATLLENVASIIAPLAENKGLHLPIDVDPGLPACFLGDENRIGQVLINLMHNAVKNTVAGHVATTVSGKAIREDVWQLRFEVADTGVGIASQDHARMFLRFAQIEGLTPTGEGAGLGLAISSQIVKAMGGDIGVESELGQGATFWFTLPLPLGQPIVAAIRTPPDGGPPRADILVVDDIEVNQEIARLLLEAEGHRVKVVHGGAEALTAVQQQSFDLVLMDIRMAGMDGIAAAKAIRALGNSVSEIPLVACTGGTSPSKSEEILKAGFDAHIQKPLNRSDLQALVQMILSRCGTANGALQHGWNGAADCLGFQEALALLGAKTFSTALSMFSSDLHEILSSDPMDEGALAGLSAHAHDLISLASLFGMAEFAEHCRALEDACSVRSAAISALHHFRLAATAAQSEIDRARVYCDVREIQG